MLLKEDVVWANGRDGGYIVLGNFVYTVRIKLYHYRVVLEQELHSFLLLVCCSDCMRKSGIDNKLLDMGHSCSNVGIYFTLVHIYCYI